MTEVEELKACRDPEKTKRLLAAWLRRRVLYDTDTAAIGALLAEAIKTHRFSIKKRRPPVPPGAHPYLAADLVDLDWWCEQIARIEDDD